MKQILGDNQFFGINHFDLDKGEKSKELFQDNDSIINFINDAVNFGMDGIMINSNSRGYEIVNYLSRNETKEIHYSIPYPHKFATMVNENGMFELVKYILKKSSIKALLVNFPLFVLRGDIKRLIPLIVDLEIPKKLPPGSIVYLQNIVTDLLIGLKRFDIIEAYCNYIVKKGYSPGLITLNPILLDDVIQDFSLNVQEKLILCFNINITGFNVFPNKLEVENLIAKLTVYKKMGMNILSSGGVSDVKKSLEYIKKSNLDYVVYGSSKIENIKSNYFSLR